MLVTNSTIKSFMAALLPVMFLWLCAACASICGQEIAEAAEHPVASVAYVQAGLAEAEGTRECDGCPFVAFPKATAPERASLDVGSQAPPADPPPTPPAYSLVAVTFVRPQPLPRAPAPPLELLSTLRI